MKTFSPTLYSIVMMLLLAMAVHGTAAVLETQTFSLTGGGPITWKEGHGHGWVEFGGRAEALSEVTNTVTYVTTGVVSYAYAAYGQTWNECFADLLQAKQRFTVDLRPYGTTNLYRSAKVEWTVMYTPTIGKGEMGGLMYGGPLSIKPIPLELGQLQTTTESCDMEPEFIFSTSGGYAGYGCPNPPQVVLVRQVAAVEPRTNANPGCRTILEVGDPINALSGNVSLKEEDVVIPSATLPLAFRRWYGSVDESAGALGTGWRHSYGWRVWETNTVFGTATNRWLVLAADDDVHWKPISVAGGGHEVEHGLSWRYEQNTNGAYTVIRPRGIRYTFTTNGLLDRISDAWGNAQVVEYTNSAVGQLPARVTQSDGRGLVFNYDASNHLVRVDTPSTNLTVTFTHSLEGRMTGSVVRAGTDLWRTAYGYGVAEVLTQRVNAAGAECAWDYIGRRGTKTWVGTNRWNETDVDYSQESLNRRVVTIHRGATNVVWYYDVDPLMRKVAAVYGPNPTNAATWYGTRFTVDEYGKFTEMEKADWRMEAMANSRTVMRYDGHQRMTNWAFGYLAIPTDFWQIAWNTNWDTITSVTDPAGHKVEWEYTNGVVCKERAFPVTNQPVEKTYSYTTNGLLAGVTNANGHWVQYQYNNYGYPTSVMPQVGPTNWMVWDSLGHLKEMRLPSTEQTTNDPPEMVPRVIAFDPDELGRIRKVTWPDNSFDKFGFDAIGNITNHTDTAGRDTRYTWLPNRKLASVTRGSSAQEATTRLEYDQQFNTTRVVDELGRTVENYQIDLQDRPVKVTNVESQQMTIAWGLANFMQSIVRFDGTTKTFAYDDGGRVMQVTYPNQVVAYRYFKNGLPMTTSNQWGVVSNAFDGANRLTSRSSPVPNGTVNYARYPAGQVSNVVSVAGTNTYALDAAERLTTLTATRPGLAAESFQYGYSALNGAVSSVAYSNGLTCLVDYDKLDRPTAMVWRNASNEMLRSRTYSYNSAGSITQTVFETGEWAVYTYDSLDRLTGERHINPAGQTISDDRYAFDLAGNRTNKVVCAASGAALLTVNSQLSTGNRIASWTVAETDLVGQVDVAGVSSEAIGTNDRFGWLYVSNLTSGTSIKPYTSGTNFWAYDLTVGLGTQKVVAVIRDQAGNTTQVTNQVFLTVVTNGTYQYNLAGCVTNIAYRGKDYSSNIGLTWDGQYQLTAEATNGTVAERHGYDAYGRRLWMWDTAGGTNWMVYDGPHVVADVNSSGALLRSYVWGPGIDNLLAMTTYGATTNTYYALKDHLNSVLALADSTGRIVEQYRCDAWGRTTVFDANGNPLSASAVGNRYCWQGREYSWKTGFYYFRARWYDPITGRWLSNDPIGISGGLNQYEPFRSNPVTFRDAFGLAVDGGHILGNIRTFIQAEEIVGQRSRWASEGFIRTIGAVALFGGIWSPLPNSANDSGAIYCVSGQPPMQSNQFGNFLAGYYAGYSRSPGMLWGMYAGGIGYAALGNAVNSGNYGESSLDSASGPFIDAGYLIGYHDRTGP